MTSFMTEDDIEAMFQALHEPDKPRVAPVKYQPLQATDTYGKSHQEINFLSDVDLTIDVELGSTRLTVREILDLDDGMVVELDCLAGDPVNISLNGNPFAKGEVVVISDYFGVRVTELVHDPAVDEEKD